jgi:hypothetical protein
LHKIDVSENNTIIIVIAMRRQTASKKEAKMILLHSLQDTDICCGRGKGFINHPGNQKFQDIIHANLERYSVATSKNGKSKVVSSIVSDLLDNGARFVKKDTLSGKWYDIGISQAHEKTGHAIRDHILNKSKRHAKQAIEKSKIDESSRNVLILQEAPGVVEVKSSVPDLVIEARTRIEELLKERDQALMQQQPDLISSGCSDLTRFGAMAVPIAVPAMLAKNELLFGGGLGANKERRKQIGDYIDLFVAEQQYGVSHQKSAHYDLSRQEVLEVCSLLAVYEQPEEESNERLTTIFPSDWL